MTAFVNAETPPEDDGGGGGAFIEDKRIPKIDKLLKKVWEKGRGKERGRPTWGPRGIGPS